MNELAEKVRTELTQYEHPLFVFDAEAAAKGVAVNIRFKPERADVFFREGRAGQWRERLSRRQIRRVVALCGEEMRQFGYLSDDIAHLAPPARG